MAQPRILTDLSSPFGLLEAATIANDASTVISLSLKGVPADPVPLRSLAELLPRLLSATTLDSVRANRLLPSTLTAVDLALTASLGPESNPKTVSAIADVLKQMQADLFTLADTKPLEAPRVDILNEFCKNLVPQLLAQVQEPDVVSGARRL